MIIINFSVEGPRASRVRPKLWWMAATSTPQHLPGGTKTMAVAAVADVVEQQFSNLLLLSPLKEWQLAWRIPRVTTQKRRILGKSKHQLKCWSNGGHLSKEGVSGRSPLPKTDERNLEKQMIINMLGNRQNELWK